MTPRLKVSSLNKRTIAGALAVFSNFLSLALV